MAGMKFQKDIWDWPPPVERVHTMRKKQQQPKGWGAQNTAFRPAGTISSENKPMVTTAILTDQRWI